MGVILSSLYLRLGQCPVMNRQSHAPGQEAGELVHLGLELVAAGEEFADKEEVVGHRPLAQPLLDARDALGKIRLQVVDGLARLDPLLDQVLVVGVAPGAHCDGRLLPKLTCKHSWTRLETTGM